MRCNDFNRGESINNVLMLTVSLKYSYRVPPFRADDTNGGK
jgi:hypothetical protein